MCGGQAQVSKSFPASLLAREIERSERSEGTVWTESGLGLRRTKVMARSAFWRVSMNEVNVSPVLPLPEYVSSCSSGNSSKGSSPSSNSRQRESCSTSPSSIQSVFTFLNGLRSLRHSVRSTSLCSSDDRLCTLCSKVRLLYYRSLCKFVKSSIQLSRLGISFILAGNSLLETWES